MFGGFDNPAASLLLAAGLLVLAAVLLRRTRRRLGRRPTSEPHLVRTPRPRDQPEPGHHLGTHEELVRWEVQMHQIARQLSARLDSKMLALEALIRDADRAAARLEAARSGDPRPPLRSAEDCREAVHLLADYGFPPAEIAARLGVDRQEVVEVLEQRRP